MSFTITALTMVVSALMKNRSERKKNAKDNRQQQLLIEQKKQKEKDKDKQTKWITISISALLIIGAIFTYYTIIKGNKLSTKK